MNAKPMFRTTRPAAYACRLFSDDLPHLSQFLGAYFHQDWDLDDPDEQEVLNRFMRSEGEDRVRAARVELNRLLAMPFDDEELSDIVFRDLGCYYSPTPNRAMRQWLRSVAERLADSPF